MKKIIVILILLLGLSACEKKEEPSISGCDIFDECGDSVETQGESFKEIYESVNGKESSSGAIYRTITIDEDHPFSKTDPQTVIQRIENKETFYLYVGDELCPWCRSVIEKAIESSKLHQIEKIDYLEIWDEEGNEILRDKYEVIDGQLKKVTEAAPGYDQLLLYFDDLLSSYELSIDDKTYDTGEKRIYAPNFIYIEKGIARKLVTGISEKQENSRDELTAEILDDERKIFDEFFDNQR